MGRKIFVRMCLVVNSLIIKNRIKKVEVMSDTRSFANFNGDLYGVDYKTYFLCAHIFKIVLRSRMFLEIVFL